MRKVGSTTDTADANGEYTNGNVANGIPPTIINAEMMNTFQRELVNVVEGAGLELDPDDDSQVLKAIGGGRLLNIVTFTKSGTYTPTKGTKKIKVTITGGGASGGKSAGSSTYARSGGAGGTRIAFINVPAGNTTITIGAGGESCSGAGDIGNAGGDSKFGNLITAFGGTTSFGKGGSSTGEGFGIEGGNGNSGASYSNNTFGGVSFWGAAAQAMMDRMRRLLMQEPMDPVVPGSIRMWANQEKVEMVFA
ncbi:TPA: phage tail protein [Escherichia coli]|nr:phage tail protein [Escherichia coli]